MKIVIVGAGEVGSHLAKMLSQEGGDITVIDSDEERLSRLNSTADVLTVQGSPTSIEVLKSAGVAKADLFVSVFPFATQEMNIVSAILAHNLGAKKVTARINDENFLMPENKLLFKEMGIELMFYPEKIAADEILEQLKHTGTGESIDFAHGKLQIALFKIEEDSPLLEMKVGEFGQLHQHNGLQFRIIAVSREDKTIIPHYDTKFLYHDLVYVIAKREGMEGVMKSFGRSNIEVRKAMIFGGSSIGELLAKSLCKTASHVKIVEKDKKRCLELTERLPDSIHIANGDGRNSDFLLEESIRDYNAFIAVTDDDETNILSCVVAKKFGVDMTVAEVENVEYIRLAEDMGVDTVINKKLITAGRIFRFTLSGTAKLVKYMSGTAAELREYIVAPDRAITAGPLKEIQFPADAIIGGIIRGNDSFIAVGDTRIEPYDRVVVFAMPEAVSTIDRLFK